MSFLKVNCFGAEEIIAEADGFPIFAVMTMGNQRGNLSPPGVLSLSSSLSERIGLPRTQIGGMIVRFDHEAGVHVNIAGYRCQRRGNGVEDRSCRFWSWPSSTGQSTRYGVGKRLPTIHIADGTILKQEIKRPRRPLIEIQYDAECREALVPLLEELLDQFEAVGWNRNRAAYEMMYFAARRMNVAK